MNRSSVAAQFGQTRSDGGIFLFAQRCDPRAARSRGGLVPAGGLRHRREDHADVADEA